MRWMRTIVAWMWNMANIVITGAGFGSCVPSKYSYNYAKHQEQRRKDFEKFGTKECKICSTKIPRNKSYCGACFFRYKKK